MSEGSKPKFEIYLIVGYKSLYTKRPLISLTKFKRLVSSLQITEVTPNPFVNLEANFERKTLVFRSSEAHISIASQSQHIIDLRTLQRVGDPRPLPTQSAYMTGTDDYVLTFLEGTAASGVEISPFNYKARCQETVKRVYCNDYIASYGRNYMRLGHNVYFFTPQDKVYRLCLEGVKEGKEMRDELIVSEGSDIADIAVSEDQKYMFVLGAKGVLTKYRLLRGGKSCQKGETSNKQQLVLKKDLKADDKKEGKSRWLQGNYEFTAMLAFDDCLALAATYAYGSKKKVSVGLVSKSKLKLVSDCIQHDASDSPVHTFRSTLFHRSLRLLVAYGVYYYLSLFAVRGHTLHPIQLAFDCSPSFQNNLEMVDDVIVCAGENFVKAYRLKLER